MSEDAPVNTGAVEWPDPDLAYFAVRRMQTKLHQWAREDLSRRFDDLYNLVCDQGGAQSRFGWSWAGFRLLA